MLVLKVNFNFSVFLRLLIYYVITFQQTTEPWTELRRCPRAGASCTLNIWDGSEQHPRRRQKHLLRRNVSGSSAKDLKLPFVWPGSALAQKLYSSVAKGRGSDLYYAFISDALTTSFEESSMKVVCDISKNVYRVENQESTDRRESNLTQSNYAFISTRFELGKKSMCAIKWI